MKPEEKSEDLFNYSDSLSKMLEFGIPLRYDEKFNPDQLFRFTIGSIGHLSGSINRNQEVSNLEEGITFSSRFFDIFQQICNDPFLNNYTKLIGSASFYLNNMPGGAKVLIDQIDNSYFDLGGEGLEILLLWLLKGSEDSYNITHDAFYSDKCYKLALLLIEFYSNGTGHDIIIENSEELRKLTYDCGTPRELLLGDLVAAVVKLKVKNSTWLSLPRYSKLSIESWKLSLKRDNFMKELWPAQHILGEAGVFLGKSAVVQMPTSAGKTKAVELIIRSSFLSKRTSLVIIVAPYRALCHEIRNSLYSQFVHEPIKVSELSDTPQNDYNIDELLAEKNIIVVTPEKLVYLIRHTPELAEKVGLVVYDEGHQFDCGSRGIIFELLLTTLNSLFSENTQKILLSAVISNAKAVSEWLINSDSIIEGTHLIPTHRSVGFVSMSDGIGNIKYVDEKDISQDRFTLPEVIRSFSLENKPSETKLRLFPQSKNDYALYLGFKLVKKGAVAIYCAKKVSANTLCKRVSEIYERNIKIDPPSVSSDSEEINRICYLTSQHLGIDSSLYKCAKQGVFAHHGSVPQGIRLSIEYAMRKEMILFVICTSTLAQGVNLPIRYLILSSLYQGREPISVRDFHNLIGRAGRAGKHNEGSILFTDPTISKRYGYKWRLVRDLLDFTKSEKCGSSLLSIFDDIISLDGSSKISFDIDTIKKFMSDYSNTLNIYLAIGELKGIHRDSLLQMEKEIANKMTLIPFIENFLMANWETDNIELTNKEVIALVEQTLAYSLATDVQKEQIIDLFTLLVENIYSKVPELNRRKVYGRTLYGLDKSLIIDEWVGNNMEVIKTARNTSDLLCMFWSLIYLLLEDHKLLKCNQPENMYSVLLHWIQGDAYLLIKDYSNSAGITYSRGKKQKEYEIEDVVDLCERCFSFEGAQIIGAIDEILQLYDIEESEDLSERLCFLQKCIKYGLPSLSAINLYELGFTDRVIALDIKESLTIKSQEKGKIVSELKANEETLIEVLSKYPSYFQERGKEILEM